MKNICWKKVLVQKHFGSKNILCTNNCGWVGKNLGSKNFKYDFSCQLIYSSGSNGSLWISTHFPKIKQIPHIQVNSKLNKLWKSIPLPDGYLRHSPLLQIYCKSRLTFSLMSVFACACCFHGGILHRIQITTRTSFKLNLCFGKIVWYSHIWTNQSDKT